MNRDAGSRSSDANGRWGSKSAQAGAPAGRGRRSGRSGAPPSAGASSDDEAYAADEPGGAGIAESPTLGSIAGIGGSFGQGQEAWPREGGGRSRGTTGPRGRAA